MSESNTKEIQGYSIYMASITDPGRKYNDTRVCIETDTKKRLKTMFILTGSQKPYYSLTYQFMKDRIGTLFWDGDIYLYQKNNTSSFFTMKEDLHLLRPMLAGMEIYEDPFGWKKGYVFRFDGRKRDILTEYLRDILNFFDENGDILQMKRGYFNKVYQ